MYAAKIIVDNSTLAYENEITGMWDIQTYISLLMGEIPRLSDDANGYGPKGKNFIAHVDIPAAVRRAFDEIRTAYPHLIRKANPLYASAE